MDNTNYTLDNRHPDDAIFETATFIKNLSTVQDLYFDKLCTNLELKAEGKDYIFDYIYNTKQDKSFDDYLDALGRTSEDILFRGS
jgi:hypothetical protein